MHPDGGRRRQPRRRAPSRGWPTGRRAPVFFGVEPTGRPVQAAVVESLFRLIEYEQKPWSYEGAGKGESPALAGGERSGQLRGLHGQTHVGKDGVHQGVGVRHAVGSGKEIQVFDDAQIGEEVEVVHDDGKASADGR